MTALHVKLFSLGTACSKVICKVFSKSLGKALGKTLGKTLGKAVYKISQSHLGMGKFYVALLGLVRAW